MYRVLLLLLISSYHASTGSAVFWFGPEFFITIYDVLHAARPFTVTTFQLTQPGFGVIQLHPQTHTCTHRREERKDKRPFSIPVQNKHGLLFLSFLFCPKMDEEIIKV